MTDFYQFTTQIEDAVPGDATGTSGIAFDQFGMNYLLDIPGATICSFVALASAVKRNSRTSISVNAESGSAPFLYDICR